MKTDQRLEEGAPPSSLNILDLSYRRDPRWETLMNRLPESVIYQHPAWLEVLKEAYGYQPMHLGYEDAAGNLCGVLPLFYRKGLRTGRIVASLFDSPVAGPLAQDAQTRAALIETAIRRTHAQEATQFQLKVMSTELDGLVDGVVGVPLFETYQLALPAHPDQLHLDSKIRRAVNKASRSGMQVREAETLGDLKAWYELYLQTMRRLVAVPKPYHFFELAWRRLQPEGLLRLLLAEHVEGGHRRLIAGILLLQWGQTVSYSFAGWRREDQSLRPNDLLHWHAIHNACEEGRRCYDFGNVRVGDQGLIQFKRKWGAQTHLIYRYSYSTVPDVSRTTGSGPTPSKGSRVRRWVTPLWQHLPTRAIRLIGDGCHALHYY